MFTQLTKPLALLGAFALLAPASAATMIEARVNLGTNSANPIGEDFFTAASGFTQGDTSHTNTLTFTDGVVEVDITMTIEGFDAGGAPAGLIVNSQATGVELGVENDQVDPGETVKFTYDAISFNDVGLPPGEILDTNVLDLILSTIRFTAFDAGVDTYTYAGVGAGGATGDDTLTLNVGTSVDANDMFTITADSGAFRILYLSHEAVYASIPEPASAMLVAFASLGMARRRR